MYCVTKRYNGISFDFNNQTIALAACALMDFSRFQQNLVVVAGMSRAGTTFLYHNLQRHPQLYLPARKEAGYFSYNYDEGVDWFRGFYKNMSDAQVPVDICGVYFMDDSCIDRILDFNPNTRIVIGVRPPLDWVYSMYGHYSAKFSVPPFREFVNGCTIDREGKQYCLEFAGGKVERTVRRFSAAFGDNLLLYDFRLLSTSALHLLREIERFSGVAPYFDETNFTNREINVRGTGGGNVFSLMMTRVPGLATFVSRAVPRRWLMSVRRRLEVADRDSKTPSPVSRVQTADACLSEFDIEYAKTVVADDERFFNRLFDTRHVIRGSSVAS